jgi:K+-sensing histidine kinase KdpD
MDEQSIRVVMIEDNPGDVDLVRAILSESHYLTIDIKVAVRLSDGLALLSHTPSVDIILLDVFLPDSRGLSTVSAVHEAFPDIPIIVLTIWDESSIGVQAVQHGAQDYLIKDQLDVTSLVRAMRYAIERNRVEMEIRQQRDKLATLVEERAHLLEQEREARARAESANELKGKFLAMVSHELRTPLTSINGFTNTLMLPNLNLDRDQQMELFRILQDETEHMCTLVEQLLDVAKMQAGVFSVNQRVVRVEDIMEHASQKLHTLAIDHRLSLEVPSALPLVIADETRIVQVLRNLVDNAAKYSPRQSQIRINALAGQAHNIEFDIVDEGPGIPAEIRERLFEPFRKADQYRLSTQNRGIGVGLAICHGIIEAHHGKIWIADAVPAGTTVSFTLPTEQSVGASLSPALRLAD